MKANQRDHLFSVILAGGRSSRLFPFNKVLSDLTGSGRTLIQQAYDRVEPLCRGQIYALTVREMRASVQRQLKLTAGQVLVDPARRGTWPALLWAIAHIKRRSQDAVIAVLTGDHVIKGDKAFQRAFRQAVQLAQSQPAMVMLGIRPSQDPEAWRGFGCFRSDAAGRVVGFEEKPSVERAQQMIESAEWQWNSGMFFFRISTAEAALRALQPDMARVYDALSAAVAAGKKSEAAFIYEDFADKIPHPLDPGHYVDNSIDYAIMTPLVARSPQTLMAAAVTDTQFRWTDLGQWNALRQILKADRLGNIAIGKTKQRGTVRDCLLVAGPGHQITLENVHDLVIAFDNRMALALQMDHLSAVKDAAQEALMHPDRIVMEHNVTGCDFRITGGRLVALGLSGLSVEIKGRRLRLWCPSV